MLKELASEIRRILEDYQDVGFVDGHWGKAGSGVLFTTGTTILLLKRAPWVTEGGTWGIPGGAIPEDHHGRMMDPQISAFREVEEEIGRIPSYKIVDEYVYRDGKFRFTTYIAKVESEFRPTLDPENTGYDWVAKGEVHRKKLHPGVVELLKHVDPFGVK